MPNRYFDHLYCELCVAAKRRVSRYDLWLRLSESGGDPDALTQRQVKRFLVQQLEPLLGEEGIELDARHRRRLERAVLGFDPESPTPAEWLAGDRALAG